LTLCLEIGRVKFGLRLLSLCYNEPKNARFKFACLFINTGSLVKIIHLFFIVWNVSRFTASDGKEKLKGILQSSFSGVVSSGSIQNLGLIRVLDYTLNDIPGKPEK